MTTTQIAITEQDGSPVAIVASVAELAEIMREHPNARYDIRVVIDNPCELHPSFEVDNCPACGTSAKL
jgi:hypothetical protein